MDPAVERGAHRGHYSSLLDILGMLLDVLVIGCATVALLGGLRSFLCLHLGYLRRERMKSNEQFLL